MSNDAHQTETWVHWPLPGSGSPFLNCVVYKSRRRGVAEPVCIHTPHVSATQSPSWTKGAEKHEPTSHGSGCSHTESLQGSNRMQFARTRCMVTIPKVSPFHCRKTCGVALSRIAHTHTHTATQPASAGPAPVRMLLGDSCPTRGKELNIPLRSSQG